MTARTMPTPPSFAYQSNPTSGQLNQLVAWTEFWANPPMFKMIQSVAQTNLASGTPTQVTFDTPQWDTDSGRQLTTPWNYTIPVGFDGRWDFSTIVNVSGNASGYRYAALYKNGAAVTGGKTNSAVNTASNSTVLELVITVAVSGGDTIGIFVVQNSGATLSTVVSDATQVSIFEGRMASQGNP